MKFRASYFGKFILLFSMFLAVSCGSRKKSEQNSTNDWTNKMALSVIKRFPQVCDVDENTKLKWDYKEGFLLGAYKNLYLKTGNAIYLNYIEKYPDQFVNNQGEIVNYHLEDYNMDSFEPGKLLLFFYQNTKEQKYLTAIQSLQKQLSSQPRTAEGGFWHKKIYPNQMWLDGLFMGTPFYSNYTSTFENGKNLDDVAKQFENVEKHFKNKKSGLFFQCWDSSKKIAWANKFNGTSPTIWSRGNAWFLMVMVDALDYFPENNPKKKELVSYFRQLSSALAKTQDASGLWFQVKDQPNEKGNYLESSSTLMIAYAFAKGEKKHYLDKNLALKTFNGILKTSISTNENGELHLKNICPNAGLGGNPFRDGSFIIIPIRNRKPTLQLDLPPLF